MLFMFGLHVETHVTQRCFCPLHPPVLLPSLSIPFVSNQISIAIEFHIILKVKNLNRRFYNWFFFHSAFEMRTMCVIFSYLKSSFTNQNCFVNQKSEFFLLLLLLVGFVRLLFILEYLTQFEIAFNTKQ